MNEQGGRRQSASFLNVHKHVRDGGNPPYAHILLGENMLCGGGVNTHCRSTNEVDDVGSTFADEGILTRGSPENPRITLGGSQDGPRMILEWP